MRKSKAKALHIDGRKFGRLLVVREDVGRNNSGSVISECVCDCGKIIFPVRSAIIRGMAVSCGCFKKDTFGFANKKQPGIASFNIVYHSYKTSAIKRGYNFDLSKDEFGRLTQQPCAYCGTLPSNKRIVRSGNGDYVYNGIDRIDNNIGYTKENSIPCCYMCNAAKSNNSISDFIEWVHKVHNHTLNNKINGILYSLL